MIYIKLASEENNLDLSKKIWLTIINDTIKNNPDSSIGLKKSLELMKASQEVVKIDDLLPLFNVSGIDSIRDEVCNALENYALEMEKLKASVEVCCFFFKKNNNN